MAADAADGGEQQPGSGADGVGEDGGDTRGHRDTDPVEQEGKSDVLLDAPVGGAACPVRPKHGAQVFVQGDDVGGLDGDVGAVAHGDADVGLHEGGGVVDAVADHRHPGPVGLELADQVGFAAGQDPGVHPLDAELAGGVGGGGGIVAGNQDRFDAQAAQLGDE